MSYDFLQPLKKGDKYINVQCSLSSFFVDRNNVIYGDYFKGTLGTNVETQLFAISQSSITPICHKKKDIQIPIVGDNATKFEKSKNSDAIKYINEVLSNAYNGLRQPKLKKLKDTDNCLEKIYEKYEKLNKKISNMEKYKKDIKYYNTIDQKNFILFNGKKINNVYHDELIAVPKDEEYKIFFDCQIIIQDMKDVENIKKNFFIQAKCGYPYIITYNQEQNKLEYRLMSEYIEYLKKTNVNAMSKLKQYLQQEKINNKNIQKCIAWFKKVLNCITINKKDEIEKIKKDADILLWHLNEQIKQKNKIIKDLNKNSTQYSNIEYEIKLIEKRVDAVNATLQRIKNIHVGNFFYTQILFDTQMWLFNNIKRLEEYSKFSKLLIKGYTSDENQDFLQKIDKDIDLQKIKDFENKQINYIYQQKSKDFNCDISLLKDVLKDILKTNNEEKQLNFLSDEKNKIKLQKNILDKRVSNMIIKRNVFNPIKTINNNINKDRKIELILNKMRSKFNIKNLNNLNNKRNKGVF